MRKIRFMFQGFLLVVLVVMQAGVTAAAPTRIKDLVALEGVRDNPLVGYGIVVGLAGTGDKRQTVFSAQTLANVLLQMGVTVSPQAMQVRNVAAVLVTANLPPFAQSGTRIDISVAAAGDATSLQGGLLLMTPLKGVDGQVYAIAQGPVVTGAFVAGRTGTSQTLNHPTVGRVPAGAIIERTSPSQTPSEELRLQLARADFTTAARIAEAINRHFPAGEARLARAENSALVAVRIPDAFAARSVEFVSQVENLLVEADRRARIVINERTGTIVLGKEVRIAPVAVLHGNLTVEIQTTFAVSQPAPLSSGETVVTPEIGVGVREEKARNVVLKEGATIEELVRALLAIGSTPRDVIAILQNLRAAGALDADIEVI
jgi:flagellar P-ring protein precursor FlgI